MINNTLKKNTIFLYIAYIPRYLFPILLIPYLTRVIGFEDWGRLVFYIAYGAYIEAIIDYGFDFTGTRDISVHRKSKKKIEKILSTVITSKLFLSALCLIATLGLTVVFEGLREDIELFIGLTLVSIASSFSMFWYFKGIEEMKMVTYLTITSYSVSSILVFSFIKSPDDIILYPLFFFCSAALVSTIALSNVFSKNIFYFSNISDVISELKNHFRMMVVRVSPIFFINGNIICVALLFSEKTSAAFSLSLKLVHSVRMLLTPFVDAGFPNISSLIKEDENKAKSAVISLATILLLLSFAMTLGIYFSADLLIFLFAGVRDVDAVSMVKALSLLPIIIAVTHAFGPLWMMPLNMDGAFTKIISIAVSLNLFLFLASYFFARSIYWPVSIVLVTQLIIPMLMYSYLKGKRQLFHT